MKVKKLKWCDPGNKNCTWGRDLDENDPRKNLPYREKDDKKINWKLQQIQTFQNTGSTKPKRTEKSDQVNDSSKKNSKKRKKSSSDTGPPSKKPKSDFYQKFELPNSNQLTQKEKKTKR